MTDNLLYTADEVAKLLRVNVYTVHELLRNGRLRGFKIVTHWRIPKAEVDRFMRLEVKDAQTNADQ